MNVMSKLRFVVWNTLYENCERFFTGHLTIIGQCLPKPFPSVLRDKTSAMKHSRVYSTGRFTGLNKWERTELIDRGLTELKSSLRSNHRLRFSPHIILGFKVVVWNDLKNKRIMIALFCIGECSTTTFTTVLCSSDKAMVVGWWCHATSKWLWTFSWNVDNTVLEQDSEQNNCWKKFLGIILKLK